MMDKYDGFDSHLWVTDPNPPNETPYCANCYHKVWHDGALLQCVEIVEEPT